DESPTVSRIDLPFALARSSNSLSVASVAAGSLTGGGPSTPRFKSSLTATVAVAPPGGILSRESWPCARASWRVGSVAARVVASHPGIGLLGKSLLLPATSGGSGVFCTETRDDQVAALSNSSTESGGGRPAFIGHCLLVSLTSLARTWAITAFCCAGSSIVASDARSSPTLSRATAVLSEVTRSKATFEVSESTLPESPAFTALARSPTAP